MSAEFWKVSYRDERRLSVSSKYPMLEQPEATGRPGPLGRRAEGARQGRGNWRTVMRESCFMETPKMVGPPAGGAVASRRAIAAGL